MKESELRAFRIKMIMHNRVLQRLAKFIAILYLLIQGRALCDGEINAQCINSEAVALLLFKGGLNDPSNRLSSWTLGKDCCQWNGVECNTTTGHVISLNLHCANSLDKLQGDLNSSLLELSYLSSLILSGNDFMQSKVPSFLGAMKNLKHLDLSNANFKGNLPEENLANLSQLESLDFSGKGNSLEVDDLKWLRGLSSLKSLDLSEVDLSNNANDWFLYITTLPSLVTLRLSGCDIYNLPSSPPQVNFDSLITLDLSFNYFNTTIPDWLFENCLNLQNLNLSNTQLQGPIPDSIGRFTSLVTLDLSYNEFIGPIPSTLGQDHGQNRPATNSCLKELRLSYNTLNGSLEKSLGKLSELVVLDLAQNNLEGTITDTHLAKFKSLRVLDLSFNYLTLNLSKNWVPSFKLETIGLGNCQLGPQFPKWIQTQKNLSHIDLSNASISDTVPDWFWDLSAGIEYMNLSYNELRGCGHDLSQKLKLDTLDLSNNSFSCPLPRFPPNLRILNLASNSFHGTISHICEMLDVNTSLGFLDLSSNNFTGNIPTCWSHVKNMIILNLACNNLSGSIPDSLGSLTGLQMLSIEGNDLSGKIPDTLGGCGGLIVLNLGSNRLWGPIPPWIGVMQSLKTLILSGNSFDGIIPITICQLKSLFILDLSNNKFTGAIPRCSFDAMATIGMKDFFLYAHYHNYITYFDHIPTRLTGLRYIPPDGKMLRRVIVIDLSSNLLTEGIPMEFTMHSELHEINLSRNQLTGSIPSGVGELHNLELMDLSRNQLVGSIPSDIGELVNVEALDLSRNQLSCGIPTSMTNLTSLAYLNLSYNNLSGKIPTGRQFDAFSNDSYEGNPHLCGIPLTKECTRHISYEDMHCSDSQGNRDHDKHNKRVGLGISGFYISMGIGYFTAFWLFWISLVLITSWRYAYFRFLGSVYDCIYVTVAVALAKFRRKFQT